MTIILASNNIHKIEEIRTILSGDLQHDVLSMRQSGFTASIEENGTSFEENALIKARAVYAFSLLPVIADDSGLCVDYLNGAPGIHSARYMNLPDDESRYRHLVSQMDSVPDEKRTARFVCVIAYIDSAGSEHTFTGTCEGIISRIARGKHGFGYDPVFIPEGFSNTLAEIDPKTKNRISHRAKALEKLVSFLS
ncbi:MAG: RdgB/HAM1 family non-canonical purine NTP pyrophosphatase [Spirochaetota bacterium]